MEKLFFDIETTGSDVNKDRIIQLAIRVIDEEGNTIVDKSKMYNPGIPISKAASNIHGIKDKDIEDCPPFKSDAKKLKKLFENKIIIMYNGLRFDIPILMQEFERAGVDVELSGQFIDILKVERKLSPHTLGATYKKYTGGDLEGAHDAMKDVNATQVIMLAQQERNQLSDDDLLEMTDTTGMADYYGKLKYDSEGFLVFNFGKNKDHRIINEPNYSAWILDSNFPSQVKKLIRDEQTKGLKTRTAPNSQKEEESTTPKQKPAKSFYSPPIANGYRPIEIAGIDDLPF